MIVGLKRSIVIIEKELEFAKMVNPQMALGMDQVKKLIEKEIIEQMKGTIEKEIVKLKK